MVSEILPLFIPIIAIVMGIGIGMLSLWLEYRRKRELFELHHKERMAAIEKGIEVPPLPPELFYSTRKRRSPEGGLRIGLILFFLGIVLFAALYFSNGSELTNAFWGLIPAAIGAALVIFYFLVGRKDRPADSP